MACYHCVYENPGSCDGCPEQVSLAPHLICDYCGGEIYEDDFCWEFEDPDTLICGECVSCCTATEILEFLGYQAQRLRRHTIEARTERSDGL